MTHFPEKIKILRRRKNICHSAVQKLRLHTENESPRRFTNSIDHFKFASKSEANETNNQFERRTFSCSYFIAINSNIDGLTSGNCPRPYDLFYGSRRNAINSHHCARLLLRAVHALFDINAARWAKREKDKKENGKLLIEEQHGRSSFSLTILTIVLFPSDGTQFL